MSNKIKVAGYSKKIIYDGSIEWRPFSPDLVGFQLASNGGTPLFTFGNFNITTNLDPKISKKFVSNKYSNFLTLNDLKVTETLNSELLNNNATVLLNLDKTNLNNYAKFGSLTEFVRVSLEDIITKWPASLYMIPYTQTNTGQVVNGYTFENYIYDSLTEVSSFRIPTNFINNKFELNYLKNGSIVNTFNETNDLRNFTVNYKSYVVYYNNQEFPILNLTAATKTVNDYLYLDVKGNPFSGLGVTSKVNYHIKPEKIKTDIFFNSLPDFEYYLLSRDIIPLYTATFKYPVKSDTGVILYITDTATWPVSDGYNIDFNTTNYENYATKLLDISSKNDLISSNLMVRYLVSESISAFDTTPVHLSEFHQDTSGQKINKTLQIYGRNFDEINNFIEGIAFSNTVTYDKQNNTPDIYLKNLARVLGWELVSSVVENDLLSNYVSNKKSTFSGQSVGLTPVEADIELWRRLILNTPWLWKSKGARKSIEFLLRFIGTPNGLVTFNEYVYKADKPIDVELFKKLLELNNLNVDLSQFPFDSEGYPIALPNTNDMYFQNYGLWFRETGGINSNIDILTGNNPHLGPYDRGSKYINQFKNLIPNFSSVTVTSQTITTTSDNLFYNYNLGKFDDVTTATTVDTIEILSTDNANVENCLNVTKKIEINPNIETVLNDCGCEIEHSDKVLSITIKEVNNTNESVCDSDLVSVENNLTEGLFVFNRYQYNIDGSIYSNSSSQPILNSSNYAKPECCRLNGGTPFLFEDIQNAIVVNSGYICCDNTNKCGCTIACGWDVEIEPIIIGNDKYLNFIKPNGSHAVVTPDGCNCMLKNTVAVPNITDPFTNQVGYGCQLTRDGFIDLQSGFNSEIKVFYQNRISQTESCYNITKG
jgi:hypothetical protein